MSQWTEDPQCTDCLRSIQRYIDVLFGAVRDLHRRGRIDPLLSMRLVDGDAPVWGVPRRVRLGVYPIAANPLHWGHLVVGLSALARLGLDKVVFLIAGTDPRKPMLAPAEERHRLARAMIEMFRPLFAYSPLPLGTDLDGETNLGRLMALNATQPLEIFYIAGADHCRRSTPAGDPDTVDKVEQVSQERAARAHRISLVFVDREGVPGAGDRLDTFLDVHCLPPVPFSFSSTAARRALGATAPCAALMSLPYASLLEIRAAGLYAAPMGG
ncbi:MAG TPA: hypothetical protein VL359_08665 [bacterium]|nr:hypothetical protein [bacterium]